MPPVAIDRNSHGIDDLWQQGEQTNLRCDVIAEEHPAMTAGFDTLRDHRVTAALLQVLSLGRPLSRKRSPCSPRL